MEKEEEGPPGTGPDGLEEAVHPWNLPGDIGAV